MNKAQELCKLASGVDIENRTKVYLDFLLEIFEEEAEKGKFEDEIFFSGIASWNANRELLITMLKERGFDVKIFDTENFFVVSWKDKL